jgi:hypothetical protein
MVISSSSRIRGGGYHERSGGTSDFDVARVRARWPRTRQALVFHGGAAGDEEVLAAFAVRPRPAAAGIARAEARGKGRGVDAAW